MATSKYGTSAHLIWDGSTHVAIPEVMGTPREDQMQGTAGERLSELAGRVCYDSLGKGRSSADYHKHIQEVGHLSVLEHAYATFRMGYDVDPIIFLNRPGLWVERVPGGGWRVTVNPRSILEWHRWSCPGASEKDVKVALEFGRELRGLASLLYPKIVREQEDHGVVSLSPLLLCEQSVVEPESDEERWVTLFLAGSRGFSHELVRHGDFTAISQRSTRFVDEDGSPWVDHPLAQEYQKAEGDLGASAMADEVKSISRRAYNYMAEKLQGWLLKRGVDKFTARKQARGAARGYLGNALETEVVFSASVAQWKRMLRMRACDAADAEIRSVFIEALVELKKSRYADRFSTWSTIPAKDGIGETAVESSSVHS